MIKPTKKNQEQWVKDHLNGGSFPEGRSDYSRELRKNYYYNISHACYEAMVWLDDNNIKSLEEAWDKCPDIDWLEWMLDHMELTSNEEDHIYDAYDEALNECNSKSMVNKFRELITNPWRSK